MSQGPIKPEDNTVPTTGQLPPQAEAPGLSPDSWFLHAIKFGDMFVSAMGEDALSQAFPEETFTDDETDPIASPNLLLGVSLDYWTTLGMMKSAGDNPPAFPEGYVQANAVSFGVGLYEFCRSLYESGIEFSIVRHSKGGKENIDEIADRAYRENREVFSWMSDDGEQSKKTTKEIARVVRTISSESLEDAKNGLWVRPATVDDHTEAEIIRNEALFYHSFFQTFFSMVLLTSVTGNRSLYGFVADKLKATIFAESRNHNVRNPSEFITSFEDRMLRQPDMLRSFLDSREANGVTNVEDYAIKSRALFLMLTYLNRNRPRADEVRQSFLGLMTFAAESGTDDLLGKSYSELEKIALARNEEQISRREAAATTREFDPMELDWQILPPGESGLDSLENNAREIVESIAKRKKEPVKIDLERLMTLHKLREAWGADKCYYARGSLGSRKATHSGNGDIHPDEYIILVLQETDAGGNVIYEHAVAESPISGGHAAYVYRQDVPGNGLGWRAVMSMSKTEARKHGAKRLFHVKPGESDDLNQTMFDKISYLLACEPNEFNRIEFRGKVRIGKVALEQILEQTEE